MSPAFQTGRRSALLTRRLKRVRRRRRAALGLAAAVLIPVLLFLLGYYLDRSWEVTPIHPGRGEPDFDPQLVYTKARALLESGKSNQHFGRRDQVEGKFEESLELMLMIAEEAPGYQPDRVRRDIEFLRGRLRIVR